jgi:hypothetical protein
MFIDVEKKTVDFYAACCDFAFENELGGADARRVYSVPEAFGSYGCSNASNMGEGGG